jgi:hypothetical protein
MTARTVPSTGFVARLGRKAGLATIAALLAIGTTSQAAAAATGAYGWHGRTEVTCHSGRMQVHLPLVNAANVSTSNLFTIGGSFGGGSNLQWIGVRVWLIKWNPVTRLWHYTDQNRDGRLDATAEFQMQTTTNGPLVGINWWNADAKRPAWMSDLNLTVRDAGYYMTETHYFWYTNGQVTGSDVLSSASHYVAQYFYVAKPYCTY